MAFERPVLANPDPRHQAFVDLSCHLLEEMEADFLTTTGRAFDGHAAVFLGIEVLVGLVDETSWAGCEPWRLELGYQVLHQPDPDQVLAFMVHLSAFVVFLGKSGLVSPRIDSAWRARVRELLADGERRRAGLPPEPPAWVTASMQTPPVHTEEIRGPSGEVLFSMEVRPMTLESLGALAPPLNRAQRRALRPSSRARRRSRPS